FSDTSVHSYLVSIFFSPQRRASPTLTLASQAGPTVAVDFLQQVYFLPLISRGPQSSAWANPADVRTNEHTINRFLKALIRASMKQVVANATAQPLGPGRFAG